MRPSCAVMANARPASISHMDPYSVPEGPVGVPQCVYLSLSADCTQVVAETDSPSDSKRLELQRKASKTWIPFQAREIVS